MKEKLWVRTILSSAAMLLISTTAHSEGGVLLGGTRLIFNGDKDVASMTVTNSAESAVWLMRFWVSPYESKNNESEDKKEKPPFAVTPPLYRLDPKDAVQIRVNKLSDNFPTDRESVYYLNNLAIPPKKDEKSYQKAIQSGLQFAINTRIKLFYRPAAINDVDTVKKAPEKLTVSMMGKVMTIKNPTPYFITLSQLEVNNQTVQMNDGMIAPFDGISIPVGVAHGTLNYSTIDDRGMTTPALKKIF
ncbi:fimbrial biogenesis chaperone [Pectobacterium zantedeschiae]|uniref:fimbrial biogenesis chaperone n=1 Tax=Pectobacterium zantedeschiae TaxID=2034769 RepID=UPI0013EABE32|nr:molecular chaperone [Pectobacterium zantedeschiae]